MLQKTNYGNNSFEANDWLGKYDNHTLRSFCCCDLWKFYRKQNAS